jgi:uncharacterized lipoprotein NlpE involved in copper resistance
MKKILVIISIFIGVGCNTHPKLRCFGASTPTEIHFKNSGTNEICAIVKAVLFNGSIIQDEVCLSNNEIKSLCYELDNMPTHEVRVLINSKEKKVKLKSTERIEFDFSTIKNN